MGRRALQWSIVAMAAAIALPTSAVSAKAPKMKVVGTDPAGDWFAGYGGPVGEAAAQDLVEASIGSIRNGLIDFQAKLASITREEQIDLQLYVWTFFLVGDPANVYYQISPAYGTSFPGSTDVSFFYLMRCESSTSSTGPVQETNSVCEPLTDIEAAVDVAAGTITWRTPASLISDARSFTISSHGFLKATTYGSFTINGMGAEDNLETTKPYRYTRR